LSTKTLSAYPSLSLKALAHERDAKIDCAERRVKFGREPALVAAGLEGRTWESFREFSGNDVIVQNFIEYSI
jgi:hypothetical protein